jgi:serine/threonine protein kinase
MLADLRTPLPAALPRIGAGAEPVPGFLLVKRLGQGGFGEVWQAIGPGGFPVALKFIRLGTGGTVELRSLELMKQIRHANLLGLFGAWQHDGLLIVAMELAQGTLRDRLAGAVADGLPGVPAGELLEYMTDAARGLDYLNGPRPDEGHPHGILHRDVKPANLFLVGSSVKVGDFGVATLLGKTAGSDGGSMSFAYAAPECLHGEASAHSDQYSLAVTYCKLRCNRLPFRGTCEQMILGHAIQPPNLADLPEAEQAVVARALAKEPHQRWPNCRAFARALCEAGTSVTEGTPPSARKLVAPALKPAATVQDTFHDLATQTYPDAPPPPPPMTLLKLLALLGITALTCYLSLQYDRFAAAEHQEKARKVVVPVPQQPVD